MKKYLSFLVGIAASGSMLVSSGPAIVNRDPIPVPTPSPTQNTGFIQFNNLTIQGVSATTAPAEITATNDAAGCLKYMTQSTSAGAAIACPTPAPMPMETLSKSNDSGTSFYYHPYRIEVNA